MMHIPIGNPNFDSYSQWWLVKPHSCCLKIVKRPLKDLKDKIPNVSLTLVGQPHQIPIPRSQGKCDRWRSPIFAGKSHISVAWNPFSCWGGLVNMIESFFLVSFRFIMFIFNMFNHIWDDDWNGQGWLHHQRVLHLPTNRTLLVYCPELAMEEHDSIVWTIPEGCWLRGILWVLETLLVFDFPIRKRY